MRIWREPLPVITVDVPTVYIAISAVQRCVMPLVISMLPESRCRLLKFEKGEERAKFNGESEGRWLGAKKRSVRTFFNPPFYAIAFVSVHLMSSHV
jgi:hypothetical protein